MPGHQVDGRGLDGSAPFTAQAAKQIFKGHIALAFYQQAHGVEDRTASAMQAMQLDHALRPIREPMRLAKEGRVHPPFWTGTDGEQEQPAPCDLVEPSRFPWFRRCVGHLTVLRNIGARYWF
jgi:hypothetical protein